VLSGFAMSVALLPLAMIVSTDRSVHCSCEDAFRLAVLLDALISFFVYDPATRSKSDDVLLTCCFLLSAGRRVTNSK